MNTTHKNGKDRSPMVEHMMPRPNVQNSTSQNGGTTGKPAQWLCVSEGKLPRGAFAPSEKERRIFHLLASSIEFTPEGILEVKQIGGEIYDATYAERSSHFKSE